MLSGVLSEIVSHHLAAKYQVKCSQQKSKLSEHKSNPSSVLTFYLRVFDFHISSDSSDSLLWWSEMCKASVSQKRKYHTKNPSRVVAVGLLVCWFAVLFVCSFVHLLVCWFLGLSICCLFQCMTCGCSIVRHDFWNSSLRCTALCNGGLKHRQAAIYLALKTKT